MTSAPINIHYANPSRDKLCKIDHFGAHSMNRAFSNALTVIVFAQLQAARAHASPPRTL
jgi:hypothetical protein